MSNPDWENLGRAVVEARSRKRLTQNDVQARGGPSATLVRQIEKGQNDSISARTKSSLEQALGWVHGEVDRLLAGATEPHYENVLITDEEMERSVGPSVDDAGLATIKARKPANMSDEDFKRLLQEYEEEIEWKLNRAARERP